MDQTHAPSSKIRPRGWGLPIGVWLILGFVFIIGAFVTANILAQRSTRLATSDVARVQQDFEPLARHARELGGTVATFDRSVLAYLRSPSSENGAAIVEAGTRLSTSSTTPPASHPSATRTGSTRSQLYGGAPGGRIPARALEERRHSTRQALDAALNQLDARVSSSGAKGVSVGGSLMARPSLAEVSEAVAQVRKDTVAGLNARPGSHHRSRRPAKVVCAAYWRITVRSSGCRPASPGSGWSSKTSSAPSRCGAGSARSRPSWRQSASNTSPPATH